MPRIAIETVDTYKEGMLWVKTERAGMDRELVGTIKNRGGRWILSNHHSGIDVHDLGERQLDVTGHIGDEILPELVEVVEHFLG